MAKASTKIIPTYIKCKQGVTWIERKGILAMYRDKPWILRVNPKLLPPNYRVSCQKEILFRGDYIGEGSKCDGIIPLSEYLAPKGTGIAGLVQTFLRCRFGFLCHSLERGYYRVVIAKIVYIIYAIRGEDNMTMCRVYRQPGEQLIGIFYVLADLSAVLCKVCVDGVDISFNLIVGYICNNLVMDSVLPHLEKTIEIK